MITTINFDKIHYFNGILIKVVAIACDTTVIKKYNNLSMKFLAKKKKIQNQSQRKIIYFFIEWIIKKCDFLEKQSDEYVWLFEHHSQYKSKR